MACKITASLNGKSCTYTLAGARRLLLANYARPVELTGPAVVPEVHVAGQIGYRRDTDGHITAIVLPPNEKLYEMPIADQSLNYLDATLVGANAAKYRQHTINVVLVAPAVDLLPQIDPLALGKFVGFVIRKDGIIKVLGRKSGLEAPANGADDSSGTADADSSGFTLILQGVSDEAAPIVDDEAAIDLIVDAIVVTP
jgi:hypothetical protein